MSASGNLQLIQNVYAAFGRGDVPAILEQCTDDIDWGIVSRADVPWLGTGKGKGFVGKWFQALGGNCEFTRFVPHSFIASEEGVACLVDADVAIRKNGQRATVQDIHFFRITNGRISMWRGSEDTAHVRDLWNHA